MATLETAFEGIEGVGRVVRIISKFLNTKALKNIASNALVAYKMLACYQHIESYCQHNVAKVCRALHFTQLCPAARTEKFSVLFF